MGGLKRGVLSVNKDDYNKAGAFGKQEEGQDPLPWQNIIRALSPQISPAVEVEDFHQKALGPWESSLGSPVLTETSALTALGLQ